MSITNYTELQSSLGRWLHRSDLATAAPDLIMLAETRFNRNLRVRQMETLHSEVIASNIVALPDDWLEFVGEPELGDTPLKFVARDEYKRLKGCYGNYYTIMGSVLRIGAQINAPAELTFDYYAKIPSLSDTTAANWLISDGPDVYMYGALLEAEPYMKNDPRMETWRAMLQVALTDLQGSNDRAKFSGGTLEIGAAQ